MCESLFRNCSECLKCLYLLSPSLLDPFKLSNIPRNFSNMPENNVCACIQFATANIYILVVAVVVIRLYSMIFRKFNLNYIKATYKQRIQQTFLRALARLNPALFKIKRKIIAESQIISDRGCGGPPTAQSVTARLTAHRWPAHTDRQAVRGIYGDTITRTINDAG